MRRIALVALLLVAQIAILSPQVLAQTNELSRALEAKDAAKARALILAGADVNARRPTLVRDSPRPLLFDAVSSGLTDIVRLMLEKGANVNVKDASGVTALTLAANQGSADTVKLLLEHGADVNAQEGFSHFTALIWAVTKGASDTVQLLLDRKADLTIADENGLAPLHWAIESQCRTEIVRLLLAKGADANLRAKDGATPLMYAADCSVEMLDLLIKNGARVNDQMPTGWTALMSASRDGRAENVKVLVAHGASVNVATAKGQTALSVAQVNDVIAALRQAGAIGDKQVVTLPTSLSPEDVRFLVEQVGVRKEDCEAIYKLEAKYRDLVLGATVRRDAKAQALAGFKATRDHFRTWRDRKPAEPKPWVPANAWLLDFGYLTDAEFQELQKLMK